MAVLPVIDTHAFEHALVKKLGLDPDNIVAGSMVAEISQDGGSLPKATVRWDGIAGMDPQELVDLVNEVLE